MVTSSSEPKVDGFRDVALCDHRSSLGAIVDVHKGAGLLAVSPYLDLMLAGDLCFEDFLRQMAAGAFSRPPVAYVPSGP